MIVEGAQRARILIEMCTVKAMLMKFQMEMRLLENWTRGHAHYTVAKNWNSLGLFLRLCGRLMD